MNALESQLKNNRFLNNSENEKWRLLILLINPFLAFLYSLFSLKGKNSVRVLFWFFVLFGFSMVVSLTNSEDCSRYLSDYLQFCSDPESNFRLAWQNFFGDQEVREVKDIYVYILFYISAMIFPGNYHVVWGINTIIFAFFYTKSLTYITKLDNYHSSWPILLLTFIFLFSNPIYNSSSIRFFTASWMAVYATFRIVIDKKYASFIWLALAYLIHSTFIIYFVFVVVSLLARRLKMPLLMTLFILSFIFSTMSLTFAINIKDYLPPIIQNQIWSYAESDSAVSIIAGERFNALPLYAKILTRLPHYFRLLLLVILMLSNKKFDNGVNDVLKYVIVYYSLVNFISIIPSCARFYIPAIPFLIYLWVRNYYHLVKYNWLIAFTPIVYSYSILYWVRRMLAVIDPTIFILPYPLQFIKTLIIV